MSLQKRLIVFTFAAFALTAVTPGYAQSDTSASGATSTAAPSKKAMRAQNHELERKVRHALNSTKGLQSGGILVVARGGKITLNGSAPDNDQIQLAATVTRNVPGVTSVTNNVHIGEGGH